MHHLMSLALRLLEERDLDCEGVRTKKRDIRWLGQEVQGAHIQSPLPVGGHMEPGAAGCLV